VHFMLSHRLKGEIKSSTKTRLPLHSIELFILRRRSTTLSRCGIIFSHILFAKGRESKRAYISLKYPFLVIHAKGGESISPKQKDCTTTNFKIFSLSICMFLKNFKLVSYFDPFFQIGIPLFKLNI
jgi:hypothetical protein